MTYNCGAVQPEEFVELLDVAIAEKSLLKHPFYQDWQKGILSRRSLQLYAVQYYQHVEAFPDCLLTLAMRTGNELRDIILENLEEEINPHQSHPKLWRDFAAAVGVTEETLSASAAMPATRVLLELFMGICKERPAAVAVAALYAYEAQVPEIAEKKIVGLRGFYGVTEPKELAYFTVHQEADKVHRAAWRAWLKESARRGWVDPGGALKTANDVLDALWGLLDAVHSPDFCRKGLAV
jgi:pyrroloquinoline-quinone synthase